MAPRLSGAVASVLFLVYSVLTGLTLSVLFLIYTSASIGNAFLLAAGFPAAARPAATPPAGRRLRAGRGAARGRRGAGEPLSYSARI